jgi:phosphatidylinositol phospholipase C beta
VALNYQTSDLPVQLNQAKFEFNGGTGFILKPWVMMREGGGSGIFYPFTQSKLEDIVPARLSIKIISGSFLTEKRTNCLVEAEMYGLPADTVRHLYTKKAAAPHPFWNEAPFTFKRILLPELAILRVAVFDDDKELVGQRCLPVNHIRPGFRYIPLRDKHNQPLPLAMLFVNIKVEDWVPNEMEDVVAMLMDPISFATKALEELAKGDDLDDLGEESTAEVDSPEGEGATPLVPKTPMTFAPSTADPRPLEPQAPPTNSLATPSNPTCKYRVVWSIGCVV